MPRSFHYIQIKINILHYTCIKRDSEVERQVNKRFVVWSYSVYLPSSLSNIMFPSLFLLWYNDKYPFQMRYLLRYWIKKKMKKVSWLFFLFYCQNWNHLKSLFFHLLSTLLIQIQCQKSVLQFSNKISNSHVKSPNSYNNTNTIWERTVFLKWSLNRITKKKSLIIRIQIF